MRKDLQHQCGIKRRYSTEEIALAAMKSAHLKAEHQYYNAYQCEFCHMWHVGRKRGYVARYMDDKTRN